MSPILMKLIASAATAVVAFFLLRFALRAALGENLVCAVVAVLAGYAVWSRVAAWEIKRALDVVRGGGGKT